MQTFETTTIASARLVLRPLRTADADALYAIFSDPEVMRYWSSATWTKAEQATDYIVAAQETLSGGLKLRLAIEVADSGQLVGQVLLHRFDWQNRRCEAGYALGRRHWGNGYVTEAMAALLDYAFDALRLNRVEADVDPRNSASSASLRRLGFRHEGLLRERWMIAGEMCDIDHYGLLKSDWAARHSR